MTGRLSREDVELAVLNARRALDVVERHRLGPGHGEPGRRRGKSERDARRGYLGEVAYARAFGLPLPIVPDGLPDHPWTAGDFGSVQVRSTEYPDGRIPVFLEPTVEPLSRTFVLVVVSWLADGTASYRIAGEIEGTEAVAVGFDPAPRGYVRPGSRRQLWVDQCHLKPHRRRMR